MKIELRTDQEAKSSGLEVSSMNFDTTKSAKLFHMLSSTLYSNKLQSIIRELSSNAYDSHLMKGNVDTPFELRGPTFENPVFEIRDFGVGLTAEEAEKTILCYLGSNKDDSDDFIGGWGIGSKSPFAYSSTYEVTVFKDGYETMFTCWKDENGIPNKAILNDGETQEPNGVRIRVPIETKDVRAFNDYLREYNVWTNYNVKITIDGEELKKPEVVTEREFEDYTLKVFHGYGAKRRIVYGGFSYDMINCVDDAYDYSSAWKRLENNISYSYSVAFIINKPNLVTFNMNREVLEQTEKSRQFVRKIVADVLTLSNKNDEIINSFYKSLGDSAKTLPLAKFEEEVESALEELNGEDGVFSRVFNNRKSLIYYFIDSNVINYINYQGVYPLRQFDLKLQKSEDILKICYGTRAKPTSTERGKFFADIDKPKYPESTVFVYVKAKSEDEAKKLLLSTKDFEGYDVEKLEYFQVEVAKRIKNPSAPREKVSFVSCSVKKKRKSISSATEFIYGSKEAIESVNMNKVACYRAHVDDAKELFFFTPKNEAYLDDLMEVDNINLISVEDYVDRVEEGLNSWLGRLMPYSIYQKIRDSLLSSGDVVFHPQQNNLQQQIDSILRNCSLSYYNLKYNSCTGDVYYAKPKLSKLKHILRLHREYQALKEKNAVWFDTIEMGTLSKQKESPEKTALIALLEQHGFNFTKD